MDQHNKIVNIFEDSLESGPNLSGPIYKFLFRIRVYTKWMQAEMCIWYQRPEMREIEVRPSQVRNRSYSGEKSSFWYDRKLSKYSPFITHYTNEAQSALEHVGR